MKVGRTHFPKAKVIAITSQQIVKILPMDVPPTFSWHESERGNSALRVSSATNGVRWTVDLYHARYLVCRIDGKFSEVCKSIPSLVVYFCKALGLKLR